MTDRQLQLKAFLVEKENIHYSFAGFEYFYIIVIRYNLDNFFGLIIVYTNDKPFDLFI